MGVDASAVSGVGIVFDTVSEAGEWFQENFKGELTNREKETLDDADFREFIESTKRKDLPQFECLNAYSGRGFALYYGFGDDIKKLQQSVEKALTNWDRNFKEEPDLLKEVSWW